MFDALHIWMAGTAALLNTCRPDQAILGAWLGSLGAGQALAQGFQGPASANYAGLQTNFAGVSGANISVALNHATLVADVLAGSNTLSYMGVAPGALIAAGHITSSGATDFAGGYDSSRAAIGWLRQYPGLIGLSTPPLIYNLRFGYLEYKQSLTNVDWSALQTVRGTGVPMTLTDTDPATPTRFYRVRDQ